MDEKEIEEQENAIAAAQTAVQDNPTNANLHIDLGITYFNARQFEPALAAFQQAAAIDPTNYGAFTWMGRIYENLGQAQEALAANKHAAILAPEAIAPYVGQGIIYFDQLDDIDAAIAAFQTGLTYHPEDVFANALLGVTLARVGRFEEAISALQQSIHFEPNNTFALGNLSIIFLHLQQYDEMIATCQREIALEDGNDPRRLLGYVFTHFGRYDEAIEQLERALTLDPQDYEAQAALAAAYRAAGREQEAGEQYALAQERAYQDNAYGQACFEAVSGNFDQALPLLASALREGQVQRGWARIDPEFAFMTADPRFVALVQ